MDLDNRIWEIYELLEDDRYSQALKKVDALIKQTAPRPALLSLKAYIVMKCGRSSEALQLALQVKKSGVEDVGSLQNLSAVFRASGRVDEALELYARAVSNSPSNEELGRCYINLLIKDHRFKELQAHAIKMHRQFRSPQYLFWIVMCLMIQAESLRIEDPQLFKKDISYTLAERYLQKAASEKLIKSYEGKKELALGLLDGPLGKSARVAPKIRYLRLDLLASLQHHDRVLDLAAQILEEDIDNWNAYMAYIDSVVSLFESKQENNFQFKENINSNFSPSEGLSKAQSFIQTLKDRSSKLPAPKRGPFLAELELSRRIHGDTLSVIIQYLNRFGSKACGFEDLVPYLDDLAFIRSRSEDIEVLDNYITKELNTIKLASLQKKDAIKQVQVIANLFKIQRFLSSTKPENKLEKCYQIVEELMKTYTLALPLGSELEATEKQYGDDLALLAVHYLIDAYSMQHDNMVHLVHASIILEHSISHSPHNFHLKFLLVRIYNLLGVYQRSSELFMSLDIKHVQLDTLSHLIVDSGVSLGQFENTFSACHSARVIYSRNRAETPEMLVKAFQHSTFSKIPEFIKFQSKLENSLQRRVTDFELLRSELFSTQGNAARCSLMNSVPEAALTVDIIKLSDNRDFDVLIHFTHSSVPDIESAISLFPRRSPVWIHSMMLMYRILITLIKPSTSVYELSQLLALWEDISSHHQLDSFFSIPEKLFLKVCPSILKILTENAPTAIEALQSIPEELKIIQNHLPKSNIGLYLHSILVAIEIHVFLSLFKNFLMDSTPNYISLDSEAIYKVCENFASILESLSSQINDALNKLNLLSKNVDASEIVSQRSLEWLEDLSNDKRAAYLGTINYNLQRSWESAIQNLSQSLA